MESYSSGRATPAEPLQRTARGWHFRPLRKLDELLVSFSPFERLLLYTLTVVLAASTLAIVVDLNYAVSTEVPTRGGTLVEGAVGTPRFVNPLLATTQSDQDLTMLIYSGLVRANAVGGYDVDLAERYEVNDDGTVYTFKLRTDASFHDGRPVTSRDVLFTVSRAQNPETRSPRRADWEGVSVAAPDDHTVVFTLPSPYAPFLENATMGILPSHLWDGVPASEFQFTQLNTNPVGSGPYRIRDTRTDQTGAPTEYTLVPFRAFTLGEANLNRIIYRIFQTESAMLAAYAGGDIDSFVVASPKTLAEIPDESRLIRIPQTRVFGIFLNQSHAPVLANAAAREALDVAVDKERLVNDILGGFGSVLEHPIPPGTMQEFPAADRKAFATREQRAQSARDILAAGGWSWKEDEQAWYRDTTKLTLTISTSDAEELVSTAHMVAEDWRAAGIETAVQIYPVVEFNQTVLRPRSYDAILFGEIVGKTLDLFAFWHSSQRNDPGLNLALYTNAKADRALAAARAEENRPAREEFFKEFIGYVAEDKPAVFLYAPELAYIAPTYLNGVEVRSLTSPAERFIGVHRWYRDTERVWNIFAPSVTVRTN